MQTRLWILLTTILTILVGNWPAFAEVHPGSMVLGLTTQPDTSGSFALSDQPPGPLRLYLMVYGYDDPQDLLAWDCALLLPQGVTVEGVHLAGGGVNTHTQPWNFRVLTRTPLTPQDGMVLLATIDFDVQTDEEVAIDVGPDPRWGDNGFMGYAHQTSDTQRLPLYHPRGGPAFTLTHVQADETTSWSHIKSLYRP